MVLAAQAACFRLDDKMNRLAAKGPMVFQSGRILRATLAARSMLAFGLLIFPGAFGQTPGKNLSSTVKSVSGSPTPNVRVSVKRAARQFPERGFCLADCFAERPSPGVLRAGSRPQLRDAMELDHSAPIGDGLKFARRLRGLPRYPSALSHRRC